MASVGPLNGASAVGIYTQDATEVDCSVAAAHQVLPSVASAVAPSGVQSSGAVHAEHPANGVKVVTGDDDDQLSTPSGSRPDDKKPDGADAAASVAPQPPLHDAPLGAAVDKDQPGIVEAAAPQQPQPRWKAWLHAALHPPGYFWVAVAVTVSASAVTMRAGARTWSSPQAPTILPVPLIRLRSWSLPWSEACSTSAGTGPTKHTPPQAAAHSAAADVVAYVIDLTSPVPPSVTNDARSAAADLARSSARSLETILDHLTAPTLALASLAYVTPNWHTIMQSFDAFAEAIYLSNPYYQIELVPAGVIASMAMPRYTVGMSPAERDVFFKVTPQGREPAGERERQLPAQHVGHSCALPPQSMDFGVDILDPRRGNGCWWVGGQGQGREGKGRCGVGPGWGVRCCLRLPAGLTDGSGAAPVALLPALRSTDEFASILQNGSIIIMGPWCGGASGPPTSAHAAAALRWHVLGPRPVRPLNVPPGRRQVRGRRAGGGRLRDALLALHGAGQLEPTAQ
jgi:hypothetical protein